MRRAGDPELRRGSEGDLQAIVRLRGEISEYWKRQLWLNVAALLHARKAPPTEFDDLLGSLRVVRKHLELSCGSVRTELPDGWLEVIDTAIELANGDEARGAG